MGMPGPELRSPLDAKDRRIAELEADLAGMSQINDGNVNRVHVLEADLVEARHWIEEYRDLAGKFEADLAVARQERDACMAMMAAERPPDAVFEHFLQERVARLEQALERIADGTWGASAQRYGYDVAVFAREALASVRAEERP